MEAHFTALRKGIEHFTCCAWTFPANHRFFSINLTSSAVPSFPRMVVSWRSVDNHLKRISTPWNISDLGSKTPTPTVHVNERASPYHPRSRSKVLRAQEEST